MVMTEIETLSSQLASISSLPNSSRANAYEACITDILRKPSSQVSSGLLVQISSLFLQNAVFNDQNSTGGGLIVGRHVLTLFEHQIAQIAKQGQTNSLDEQQDMSDLSHGSTPAVADPETRQTILQDALDQLQPRGLSFEEQASSLRYQLASLLEDQQEWIEAAKVLQAIPLDSGHRTVSDYYKLSVYMRIVRLLLEGDDPVAADIYLKRASMMIHNVPGATLSSANQPLQTSTTSSSDQDDAKQLEEFQQAKVLGLQYRLSQARIYDSQRRFAEAAVRYHELSYIAEIDQDDRNQMLSAAVTAAILSPAGPQRARTLATLMRDERTQSLPQYTILSKVFLDHIIRPHEIQAFEKMLAPHQVAKLSTTFVSSTQPPPPPQQQQQSKEEKGETVSQRNQPTTVLDRAMIEHNLLSASRIYDTITLKGLGVLLDLSETGSEETARKMILQGRLKAWIDQHSNVVFFVQESENLDSKSSKRWDDQIASTAGALESVSQRILQFGLVDGKS